MAVSYEARVLSMDFLLWVAFETQPLFTEQEKMWQFGEVDGV